MSHKKTQIFIAYARKDVELLNQFRTHLRPLERADKVQVWYDGLIEPGAVWEAQIKKNLHAADIVLLMVSADAIASDYFYDKEVADALERHRAGAARVVPMILRPCAWYATPLAELQAIPQNGKAVTTWADRDEAYADAAQSLLNIVNNIEQHKREQAEEEQRRRQAEAELRLRQAEEQRRQKEAAEAERRRAADEQRRQKEAAERKALEERQAQYAYHMAEARKLLRRRDGLSAIHHAQAALAIEPGDADALQLIRQAEHLRLQPPPPQPPYLRWAAIGIGALLALFLIARAIGGGGGEDAAAQAYREAWRQAEAESTLPAWKAFLAQYPDGERREAAQQQLDSLENQRNALLNDAAVLAEAGVTEAACKNLRAALRIDPSDRDIKRRITQMGCP